MIPLNDAAGSRSSAFVYGNVSKAFKQGEGTRLTAGAYTVGRADDHFGTKSGVMLGVEHPVNEKLYLLADWMSGNNRFGYGSAGFYYQVNTHQGFALGYSIGNSGRGNNYLTAVYTVTFA